MASNYSAKMIVLLFLCFVIMDCDAKFHENRTDSSAEVKHAPRKQINMEGGAAMMFADEFKQTLERYLFGICPQSYKMVDARVKKNSTMGCELDVDQHDLPGRLATLALRAHSASRVDCSRLGAALANTLGELARTAAQRHHINEAAQAAASAEAKKRKLSKSQKAKIAAKQRTALAVKKKAAALAAAAAAKHITS